MYECGMSNIVQNCVDYTGVNEDFYFSGNFFCHNRGNIFTLLTPSLCNSRY